MKVAVYTAMSGDYDNVKPPLHIDEDFDYYFFTDNKHLEVPRPYKKVVRDWDMKRGDKLEKILIPKEIRGNYDVCVWHDASMYQTTSLKWLVEKMDRGFAIPTHKTRDCVTQELDAISYYKKADLGIVNRQVQSYLNEGFPVNFGLWEAGFMIRELNNRHVETVCNAWWNEVASKSMRDQLSLPYVFYKNNFKPNYIPRSAIRGVYFRVQQHK